MLYTSKNKNVKRVSDSKSYRIIGGILLIAFIVIAIWGDLS